MWGAVAVIGLSGVAFYAVRRFSLRTWRPTVWLALAVIVMVTGIAAGAWAADVANPTFEEWDEVRADYQFQRYFAALVPVIPATAVASVLFWRALLARSRPDSTWRRILSSTGCGFVGFVVSLLCALLAAAGVP